MKPKKRSARGHPRQTRLDFTPLPSSSPAAAHLSPDVRGRAAAVDYVESPSPAKRQKIKNEDDESGTNISKTVLPTPEQSSQLRSSATQARLTMTTPIKRESDVDDDQDSDTDGEPVSRSQRRQNTFLNSAKGKSQKKISLNQTAAKSTEIKEESDSSSEGQQEGTDSPVRRDTRSSKKQRKKSPEAASTPPAAGKRTTRASRRKTRTAIVDPSEDGSDNLEISTRQPQEREPEFGDPESSGDDALASSPGKKAGGRKKKAPEVYSEEEESEDELPVLSRKRRAPAVYESEEEDEEDEDEDEPVTQRKFRQPPSKIRQEREDLAEDLEFLGSSPRKLDSSRRPKTAPRVKSAREKALEALKRRRAGDKPTSPEPEEQPGPRRRRALYDTESDPEVESEEEEDIDEDEDEVSDEPHPATVHQASTIDMFQEDDDDEQFVVEDEDDTIGVPGEDAMLPLQFSSLSRAKAKDLFKYAVEWMVQKKLNPAFEIQDEVYSLTFNKLDDEVRGLAGSKFTSSAWTMEFTRALHARPVIELVEIGGASRLLLENHCGACNRRSHPATWDIRFTGKPYHANTLEEVESDSEDSEEDSDDDHVSYDAKGNEIPSEDTVFHVGVFCKTNAQTAHALAHWRYHLYEWVVDWLRMEGYLDPEKIVERDSWKTKKRRKYANKVVDTMAEKGEIKRLYQDFKTEIDHARSVKQAGWDRYGR